MNNTEFNQVSVIKEANVHFDGQCISHTILFEDGQKKMLGVILPTGERSLSFKTHTSERMEIVSGECEVWIEGKPGFVAYRTGQSFLVKGKSEFQIRTDRIINYVCHLEG